MRCKPSMASRILPFIAMAAEGASRQVLRPKLRFDCFPIAAVPARDLVLSLVNRRERLFIQNARVELLQRFVLLNNLQHCQDRVGGRGVTPPFSCGLPGVSEWRGLGRCSWRLNLRRHHSTRWLLPQNDWLAFSPRGSPPRRCSCSRTRCNCRAPRRRGSCVPGGGCSRGRTRDRAGRG